MKKTKITGLLIGGALIFAGIFAGFGRSDKATEMENHNFGSAYPLPRFESLNGTTEFYLRPIGDDRVWHIVSRYSSLKSNEGPGYNTANYTFSSDSVCVINEFVVVPEDSQTDISLSGLIYNNINSNKQN